MWVGTYSTEQDANLAHAVFGSSRGAANHQRPVLGRRLTCVHRVAKGGEIQPPVIHYHTAASTSLDMQASARVCLEAHLPSRLVRPPTPRKGLCRRAEGTKSHRWWCRPRKVFLGGKKRCGRQFLRRKTRYLERDRESELRPQSLVL